jgi:hypothetical protein
MLTIDSHISQKVEEILTRKKQAEEMLRRETASKVRVEEMLKTYKEEVISN